MRSLSGHRTTAIFAILVIAACQCVVVASAAADGDRDDGWRRTIHGWEQSGDWAVSKVTAIPLGVADLTPAVSRYDFHPALLIVVQLSLAVGGMFLGAKRQPGADS